MIHESVPWPILHAIVYNDGRRLPKLIREIPPEPVQTKIIPFTGPKLLDGPTDLMLSEDDLRYWVGHPTANTGYSRCRWCGLTRYTAVARREHFKFGECRRLIGDTCSHLRHQRLCVTCLKKTACMKWGMPFCGEKCRNIFRYNSTAAWDAGKKFLVDEVAH